MSDNVPITPGAGPTKAASRAVTYSNETAQMQVVALATVDGADDAKAVQDIGPSNPLPVWHQALEVLRRIANLLKPLGIVTGGGSNRLNLDVNNITGGTITTVSTVTNVAASTLTNIGPIPAYALMQAQARTAYNTGIRQRL